MVSLRMRQVSLFLLGIVHCVSFNVFARINCLQSLGVGYVEIKSFR